MHLNKTSQSKGQVLEQNFTQKKGHVKLEKDKKKITLGKACFQDVS